MEELKNMINAAVQGYGKEAVERAINELQLKANRRIPTEFKDILDPHKIADCLFKLDAAVEDVLRAGQEIDEAYQDRATIVARIEELDTEIKLVESEAIMLIKGEARSQYVEIGDTKTVLANEQSRDAYRRMASKSQREELSKEKAKLAAIESNINRAKDKRDTTREANENLRRKAHVQAALLEYLK